MITTTAKNPKVVAFIGISQTCPECHGSGQIRVQRIEQPLTADNAPFDVRCTRCGGSGMSIVEVIEQHNNNCDCDSCKRGSSKNG